MAARGQAGDVHRAGEGSTAKEGRSGHVGGRATPRRSSSSAKPPFTCAAQGWCRRTRPPRWWPAGRQAQRAARQQGRQQPPCSPSLPQGRARRQTQWWSRRCRLLFGGHMDRAGQEAVGGRSCAARVLWPTHQALSAPMAAPSCCLLARVLRPTPASPHPPSSPPGCASSWWRAPRRQRQARARARWSGHEKWACKGEQSVRGGLAGVQGCASSWAARRMEVLLFPGGMPPPAAPLKPSPPPAPPPGSCAPAPAAG